MVCNVKEEHRVRVFENRVLREVLAPEWEEVTGDWIKLHIEEPLELCFVLRTEY